MRSDKRARIIPKPYRSHVGEQHHSMCLSSIMVRFNRYVRERATNGSSSA
jgi:hypothetical protein